MKPPCEIVVWYVIPSIRSKLAKELLKLGMKQKDISKLLDITQPAVSQYISDKRGHEIDFDPVVEQYIKNMAKDMTTGDLQPIDLIPKFCHICKTIKTQEVLCQLHKEKVHIPEYCNVCMGSKSGLSITELHD
ncbi:MAG: helix-turn-helix domain-containing protein [Methanosphaera sp.]|uniref:transcriptional regulator n=1 Tax=Methanosphaera sp. ISO3-F5 TaxID=1452353 RepID=UPI002B25B864|nr:helix-turn-helix domain-containing protein [Methanosphaera sp. ISO3-F5]MBR0473144.1 helix-turn-helix domain-containing protein [Methanosphaera sp.]WQH63430.1 helix-turn-helix domain-containing protein [Methanosphaera sp. ISO3-F5]